MQAAAGGGALEGVQTAQVLGGLWLRLAGCSMGLPWQLGRVLRMQHLALVLGGGLVHACIRVWLPLGGLQGRRLLRGCVQP